MTAVPAVVQQPPRHPYVDPLARAATTVTVPDVWDVASWADLTVDVVHVHFGFEHLTRERLAAWLAAVRRRRTAVVYTLHDLDNPHLTDQRHHHRLVELLTARADHVFTLTRSVATAARAVIGPVPTLEVVAHHSLFAAPPRNPHVSARRGPIYVHAATVRPNLDVELLVQLVRAANGLGVEVHLRHGAALPAAAVDAITRAGGQVRCERRLTDAALGDRIARASLLALPYRWGSHSGLLELAKDVGTTVVAPDIGGLVEQGAVALDPADLPGSLARAGRRRPPIPPARRRAELRDVIARHRSVYRRVTR